MHTESFYELRALRLDSSHLPVYLYSLNGLLVDTGFTRRREEVLAFLREQKHSHAVVTHHHEDHSGNVSSVMKAGLQVWAPEAGLDLIARGFEVEFYRWRVWGYPERGTCEKLPPEVRAGALELRAVPAPGHSEDMVVLHLPERGWLFAGDLFIGRRLRFMRSDEDANALIRSLDRALALDFEVLFCAHRGILKDGRAQLQAKRDYLGSARDQVRELNRQGFSAREITRRVFGREGFIYYFTGGKFAAINFVKSFLKDLPPAAAGTETQSRGML